MKRDWIYLIIIGVLVFLFIRYWNRPLSAKVDMSLSDLFKPGGWSMLLEKLNFQGKIGSWQIGFGGGGS